MSIWSPRLEMAEAGPQLRRLGEVCRGHVIDRTEVPGNCCCHARIEFIPFARDIGTHGGLFGLARDAGRGFPKPDGYTAAIAAAHDFAVASRDTSAFRAAGLKVVDPWNQGK